uniref:Uncharacterized protein n=1 Tax=Hippocampus comes TaxID=109280 RepID=A0A3Q2XQP3_HIPCM
AGIKDFLRIFSLANAGVGMVLRRHFFNIFVLKLEKMLIYLFTDHTNKLVTKGSWCPGGHPVLGSNLPLSIPPETMDSGLYGELSLQLVTLLSPCVLQYPNLETLLTHMEVSFHLFLRSTTASLANVLWIYKSLLRSCSAGPSCEGGIVYALEHETCQEPEKRFHLHPVKQKLLIFLFLQHTDPFASQLSDFMGEGLLEQTPTRFLVRLLQASKGLETTTHTHNCQSIILSASISIVSCSTNLNFRKDCLSRMQVSDTHDLTASLRDALLRVISWRSVPRKGCYSAQVPRRLVQFASTCM